MPAMVPMRNGDAQSVTERIPRSTQGGGAAASPLPPQRVSIPAPKPACDRPLSLSVVACARAGRALMLPLVAPNALLAKPPHNHPRHLPHSSPVADLTVSLASSARSTAAWPTWRERRCSAPPLQEQGWREASCPLTAWFVTAWFVTAWFVTAWLVTA